MTHSIPVEQQDTSSFDGDPAVEQVNKALIEDGQVVEEKRMVNYFAPPERQRFYLPDGVQYFEYVSLTEGRKAKYERLTNSDIRVQRATGDARLPVDPATERQALVKLSTVDVNIHVPSKLNAEVFVPLKFDPESPTSFWDQVFNAFPPKIIQDYYRKLRDANPFFAAEDDIEGMEEELKRLEERIKLAKEEKAKKESS